MILFHSNYHHDPPANQVNQAADHLINLEVKQEYRKTPRETARGPNTQKPSARYSEFGLAEGARQRLFLCFR